MSKELPGCARILPGFIRKRLEEQTSANGSIVPGAGRPDFESAQSDLIKEIHGKDTPLTKDDFDALLTQKNDEYENGAPELQKKPNELRIVEVAYRRDYDKLAEKIGLTSYEEYLAHKYAVINSLLEPLGITAVVSRLIILDDSVAKDDIPGSWHAGWLDSGFRDSNGAHGIWYEGDEFNPQNDSRWNNELKVSADNLHEWKHLDGHITHMYEDDAEIQNTDHPALAGIPAPWRKYYNHMRWVECFMNGGDQFELPQPLQVMFKRRLDEGWLHDDARSIAETAKYPKDTPANVVLNFGSEWAGADLELYRIVPTDDSYDPKTKVLDETPLISGTIASETTDTLEVGDVEIGDPYRDLVQIVDIGAVSYEEMDPKTTLMLAVVTKDDGTKGWMYIGWGDLFLADNVERERLNITLATKDSLPPETFEFSTIIGDIPPEEPAPPVYHTYLPIVVR